MKNYVITGIYETRQVFIDGFELRPEAGQAIMNHSPDGFNWGYGGSGPAQLALSIVLEITGTISGYQSFKWDVIARLKQGEDFQYILSDDELKKIISKNPGLKKRIA